MSAAALALASLRAGDAENSSDDDGAAEDAGDEASVAAPARAEATVDIFIVGRTLRVARGSGPFW